VIGSIIPPTSVIPKSFQTFGALGQPEIQELKKNQNTAAPATLAEVGRVVVVDAS
jgi:hypothetical protein